MLKSSIPNTTKRLVITAGEPAGIGADILVMLAQYAWPVELVVCADLETISARADRIKLPLSWLTYQPDSPAKPQNPGTLTGLNIPCPAPVLPGKLNIQNAHYVINMLQRACQGCIKGEFAAMITAPVHKGIINQAKIPFTGHTEYLAEQTHTKKVVMMLSSSQLRVALATTHLPLKSVANAITREDLTETIIILHQSLIKQFHITHPRIHICGLNPHAGENGHFGTEEIDVIIPVIQQLNRQGLNLTGPLAADTLFQNKYLDNTDVVLAMYHDQGLPVLKYQGFGQAVNITLGLPFTRTSVDHGTALELAGTGSANPGSLLAAINQALKIVHSYEPSETSPRAFCP